MMRGFSFLLFVLLCIASIAQELPRPVVAATGMNILYRGIENPVEVAVPNFPDSSIQVTATNCVLVQKTNGYSVKPGKGKSVIFQISGKKDGQTISLGKTHFRVKNIPDPKAYFAGRCTSDSLQGKYILAAQGVIAKMDGFEFDIKFNIISYTVTAWVDDKPIVLTAKSPRVTPEMKILFHRAKPRQIQITEVKAKGPDGTIRNLNPIILNLRW